MIATYIPHHLPNNRSESSKTFRNVTDVSVIVPEMHKQMIQTSRKSSYGGSHN